MNGLPHSCQQQWRYTYNYRRNCSCSTWASQSWCKAQRVGDAFRVRHSCEYHSIDSVAALCSSHWHAAEACRSLPVSCVQGYDEYYGGGGYGQGGYGGAPGGYGAPQDPYAGGYGGPPRGPGEDPYARQGHPVHGPNGWVAYRTPDTGETYYHNHNVSSLMHREIVAVTWLEICAGWTAQDGSLLYYQFCSPQPGATLLALMSTVYCCCCCCRPMSHNGRGQLTGWARCKQLL